MSANDADEPKSEKRRKLRMLCTKQEAHVIEQAIMWYLSLKGNRKLSDDALAGQLLSNICEAYISSVESEA